MLANFKSASVDAANTSAFFCAIGCEIGCTEEAGFWRRDFNSETIWGKHEDGSLQLPGIP